MTSAAIMQAINVAFAAFGLLEKLGINLGELIEAQKKAKEEGRDELNAEERQVFIDQAQSAVDRL